MEESFFLIQKETPTVPVWAVDGLTTLAGFQLSFEFLGLYGSIQLRTLHHCVSFSLSLADKLCRIVACFVSIFFGFVQFSCDFN